MQRVLVTWLKAASRGGEIQTQLSALWTRGSVEMNLWEFWGLRINRTLVRQEYGAKSNGDCGGNFRGFVESSFNPKPKMFTQDSENTSPYHTHTHIHIHIESWDTEREKYTSDWAGNIQGEWRVNGKGPQRSRRACWLERGWTKWQNTL